MTRRPRLGTPRKRARIALAALAFMIAPQIAFAQGADQKAPLDQPLPPPGLAPSEKAPIIPGPGAALDGELIEEPDWREIVSGKTLTYESAAGLIGREYYVPGGDRVIFVYYDGRCFDGRWIYENGYYCFEYDGFYCFQHFRRDGQIMVREQDGGEQRVTSITSEILSCEPQLLSRAPGAPDFNALASFAPRKPARRPSLPNNEG